MKQDDRKSKWAGVFGFAMSLFLMGCINSPLLNHADASPNGPSLPQFENPKCPLDFGKQDLCASISWVKLPTDEEKGEFTLRFWKRSDGTEAGPYVTPTQDVFVKLWMPTMGHGSSPVTVRPALDQSHVAIPGIFEASEVYFVMSGDWEIWIQLRLDRVVIDQTKIDVKI